MTNDRYKTFESQLEFWQWAIQEPGKRKARSVAKPDVYFCISYSEGFPPFVKGSWSTIVKENLPLESVEDEHGLIPKAIPTQDYITDLESAIGIISAITHNTVPTSREAYTQTSTQLLIDAIRKIADERIAATTVEVCSFSDIEWRNHSRLRLKPYGGL